MSNWIARAIIGVQVDDRKLYVAGTRQQLPQYRNGLIEDKYGVIFDAMGDKAYITLRVAQTKGGREEKFAGIVEEYSGMVDFDSSKLAEHREVMKRDLTRLGLWDENKFGLWAVLKAS